MKGKACRINGNNQIIKLTTRAEKILWTGKVSAPQTWENLEFRFKPLLAFPGEQRLNLTLKEKFLIKEKAKNNNGMK